jgi:hypothetical protein
LQITYHIEIPDFKLLESRLDQQLNL